MSRSAFGPNIHECDLDVLVVGAPCLIIVHGLDGPQVRRGTVTAVESGGYATADLADGGSTSAIMQRCAFYPDTPSHRSLLELVGRLHEEARRAWTTQRETMATHVETIQSLIKRGTVDRGLVDLDGCSACPPRGPRWP